VRFFKPHREVLTDPAGNSLPDLSVTVAKLDGGATVLYGDMTGAAGAISNTLRADKFGEVRFWARDGIYRLTISFTVNGTAATVVKEVVIGSGGSTVVFESDKVNVTDELRAFIEANRSRLADEFGANRGIVPSLRISGLGRRYTISEKLFLDKDLCGLVLADMTLDADIGASAWASDDCMLQFGDGDLSTQLLTHSGVDNITLVCNRVTSGLNAEYTNSFSSHGLVTDGQLLFGLRAWRKNRALSIHGGKLQEWGNNATLGKRIGNRTAYGLWIEKSDGEAYDVVCPINKAGIYINNIRNFLFVNCHPWMGDLDPAFESVERYECHPAIVGSDVDTDPGEDDSVDPSGVTFQNCYFDQGPILVKSFANQFLGCRSTMGNDREPVPAFILEANVANERATGFQVSHHRFSRNYGSLYQLTTNGGGWSDHPNFHFVGCVQGSVTSTDQKLASAVHLRDMGENGTAEGARTGYGQILFSNYTEPMRVAGRYGSLAIHSKRQDDGEGVVHTQWGTASMPPAFIGGVSTSANIGEFGGFPGAGRVLVRFQGTGDNGTDLSNQGAIFDAVAYEDWTSISTPTAFVVKLTPSGSTSSASMFEFSPAGIYPTTDGTGRCGTASKQWERVTSLGFYVGGQKVVGARVTGWNAPTGTLTRGTFSATATLATTAETLAALITDLRAHGVIGT